MTVRFDPERVLRVLVAHGVRFVLVGGLAAVAHGSPLPTTDVDITPERSSDNLERLAGALRELGARIRTADPAGVVFPATGAFLAAQPHMLNLVTEAGDLDIVFTPAAFADGYASLIHRVTSLELADGVMVDVADLDAIIESKEAADRETDRRALPYLQALADELDGR